MTGVEQTVVMTGASRGIGRIAARQMLSARPETHLVLLSRNDPRDLVSELQAHGGSVSVVHADLQTPVPDLTGAPVFRLGADGGRSVEFTLPSGIFYVRAESADGSAGGTFGLAAARLP